MPILPFTGPTTTSDQASAATPEQMTAPPAVILATEVVTSSSSSVAASSTMGDTTTVQSVGVPMPLIWWTSDHQSPGDYSSTSSDESSCLILADEHETQLKNLTLVNVLILVVLFIVFIANAREGKYNILIL